MIPFTNAVVTITHQGQSLVINTTDAEAATVGQVPSAIDTIDVAWSRASARDHSDPSTGTLTLVLAEERHPVIRWDALVTIEGDVYDPADGTAFPVLVWRGWITQTTWERRTVRHPATGAWVTTWRHTVTMTDLVGRAGSTKIGDTPWPAEGATERLARVEAKSPYPLISPDIVVLAPVAARDVDNIELLEPVRAAVVADLRWIHDSDTGLVAQDLPGNALAFMWGQSSGGRSGDAFLVDLDAAWIVDAPRTEDRQTRVTAVTINYVFQPTVGDEPEDRTLYIRDSSAVATSELQLDTDLRQTEVFTYQGKLTYLRSWADSLIELTSEPIAVLGETELRPDLVGNGRLANLIDLTNGRRTRTWVQLVNAPDTIGVYQHVTGGHLTIDGRHGVRLAITMQPTVIAGQVQLVWSDWPNNDWPGITRQPVWSDTDTYWADMTVSTIPWSGQ